MARKASNTQSSAGRGAGPVDSIAQDNLLASYAMAVEHMAQGVCVFDGKARLAIANQTYARLYELPPDLVRPGTPHDDLVNYRVAHGMQQVGTLQSFMDRHKAIMARAAPGVALVQMKSGALISIAHRTLPDGGWVATHQDVTDDLNRVVALEARERDLARQNLRFDAAVNNMSQGLCMFDAEQRLVICNGPYALLYELPPELTAPGTPFADILAYRVTRGFVPEGNSEDFLESRADLIAARAIVNEDVELKDGRIIALGFHPMADGGWVATHEDVTEQRQQQHRIRHLARHDGLTDLPNRIYFSEEMERMQVRAKAHEQWALLYFDLDHFKQVNDTLGHAVGDALLKGVARRLDANRREHEMAARLGGDEFALLVGPLDSPEAAGVVAQRIVDAMAKPFSIEGHEVTIGTSVGIALSPQDGADSSTLMKSADLALYRAKSEGRGNFQYFEAGMNATLQERRFLETGVKAALALRQFRLVYQPLVNLEDNAICCFEALLRWDHPERGTIPPDTFIPVAEETGAIVAIGQWVLNEACRAAAHWPSNVRVAVNLSPAQFKSRNLVAQVASALSTAGISGERLELEITESLLLAETELTLDTLHQLRTLGVRISMDDFGTGYSSLSYLRAFPFDKIKIDRSFVADLASHEDSHAIIEAVIGLGHSLGMETTAEGIETEEQLAIVRAQGCKEVQGFLFSPPISSAGADEMVKLFDGKRAPAPRARKARKAG